MMKNYEKLEKNHRFMENYIPKLKKLKEEKELTTENMVTEVAKTLNDFSPMNNIENLVGILEGSGFKCYDGLQLNEGSAQFLIDKNMEKTMYTSKVIFIREGLSEEQEIKILATFLFIYLFLCLGSDGPVGYCYFDNFTFSDKYTEKMCDMFVSELLNK